MGTPTPIPAPGDLQPTPGGSPPPPIAPFEAAAGGAYRTVNGATGGRDASEAAFANRAVPTAAAASIDGGGARTATISDAAFAADYTKI